MISAGTTLYAEWFLTDREIGSGCLEVNANCSEPLLIRFRRTDPAEPLNRLLRDLQSATATVSYRATAAGCPTCPIHRMP